MNYPARAVVDSNVLIVANGKSSHSSTECVIAATEFLSYGEKNAVIVLDSSWLIFDEYRKYCSFRGQPGAGDRFFLHLHQTQADPRRVQKVEIHQKEDGSFAEVPDMLSGFDRSDHKFVATVIADRRQSVIVNSSDSDWREAAEKLAKCEIEVIELCPNLRRR
ncbi:hypothetical protein [Sphaerisporangium corydalis]|uniref:PIN domain-containing protein n=1 Tax=Sphaerisporangium corydalis TaxID=1441875 RepID=A0ABV9EJH6_9ACTN|nr:hypothetical protein [Sphaerisporangium corydalis]